MSAIDRALGTAADWSRGDRGFVKTEFMAALQLNRMNLTRLGDQGQSAGSILRDHPGGERRCGKRRVERIVQRIDQILRVRSVAIFRNGQDEGIRAIDRQLQSDIGLQRCTAGAEESATSSTASSTVADASNAWTTTKNSSSGLTPNVRSRSKV